MPESANRLAALWVVERLREAGHEALFAGGCVRDMLLGSEPADHDVATSATPEQVAELFPRVLLVGAKFGVAVVLRRGDAVEVATFRNDLSYSDGRRPDDVRFSTPREDAERRDFTINGMFYDPLSDEVIDYVGGRADIERQVIRTIGDPDQRLAEDYLRMLRAVRFATRLGFAIDPETAEAIKARAERISAISGERVCDELTKMLSSARADEAVKALAQLGLAQVILADLFADETLWSRAMTRLEGAAANHDPVAALAAVLCELPVRTIRKLTRHWGAANELRDALCFLARHVNDWSRAGRMPLCDFKRLLAEANFSRLADLWALQERLDTGEQSLTQTARARADGIDPGQVAPPPLVTGQDLLAMGMSPGPQFGRVLKTLYDAQLDERLVSREAALAEAGALVGAPDDTV